jgi:cell division protein DivIC
MGKKLSTLWQILARNKYLITVVLGVAVVGFLDDNSYLQRIKYELEISRMKSEIDKYNLQNEQSVRALRALQRTPKSIEKIARERYFMKADDEDIYVLSTDQAEVDDQNKTDQTNERTE